MGLVRRGGPPDGNLVTQVTTDFHALWSGVTRCRAEEPAPEGMVPSQTRRALAQYLGHLDTSHHGWQCDTSWGPSGFITT